MSSLFPFLPQDPLLTPYQRVMPNGWQYLTSEPSQSLQQYVTDTIFGNKKTAWLQDGNDFIDCATESIRVTQGAQAALCLRKELETSFCIQTANHHGVDFHPEFAQGNLLFALGCHHAVPIMGCGGVVGNNEAFPRGILLGRSSGKQISNFTRVPILPDKHRHSFVSVREAFTEQTIIAAQKRLSKIVLRPQEKTICERLIEQLYRNPHTLAQPNFRSQAAVMNAMLWQMVSDKTDLPPLMCLDLQMLSTTLVAQDLEKNGLTATLFCSPSWLRDLSRALDSVPGCWQIDCGQIKHGTFLFWRIEPQGQCIPLKPNASYTYLEAPNFSLKLAPTTLCQALQAHDILPSLFTMFFTLAMLRGVNCRGGVLQSEYLPAMAKGVELTLAKHGVGEATLAIAVSPPLTGLLPLICLEEQTGFFPAGVVDWLIYGGLTLKLITALQTIDMTTALAISLPYLAELLHLHLNVTEEACVHNYATNARIRVPNLTDCK